MLRTTVVFLLAALLLPACSEEPLPGAPPEAAQKEVREADDIPEFVNWTEED